MKATDLVKEIRIKSGLPKTVFGKEVGLSQGAIWQYENGRSSPSVRTMEKIAQRYRMFAPNECRELMHIAKEVTKRRELQRLRKHKSEKAVVVDQYKRRFASIKPYAVVTNGETEVGIYDYAISKEGFGILLVAFIKPMDGNYWFRWSPVRRNEDGRLFIRKMETVFYLDEATGDAGFLKDINEFPEF